MKQRKIAWDAVDGILLSDLRQLVEETSVWEHNSRVYVKTKFSGGTAEGSRVKRITVVETDEHGGNPAVKP